MSTHCDEYVWGMKSVSSPEPLVWFLFVHRQPALLKYLVISRADEPTLFADYKGKRVRVVMASRLGDVGITEDLEAVRGYDSRVGVEELSNFSEKSGE